MASEHTLTLKAVLDKSDVQRQLASLQSQAGGGEASQAASQLGKFSESFGRLNKVMAGAAITRSFLNLARSAELFGEGTGKIVGQVQSSMNSMFAAMATGNPVIVAFTAALEGLNAAVSNAREEAAAEAARTNELNQAHRSTMGSVRKMADRNRARELEGIAGGGDAKAIRAELDRLTAERARLEQEVQKRTSRDVSASNAGQLEAGVNRVLTLDNEISKLQTALKKVTEAEEARSREEEKRSSELAEAKSAFAKEEAAAAAKAAGDLEYFADAMEKARRAMADATDASAYNKARGEFTQARGAMEGIQADRDRATEAEEARSRELAEAKSAFAKEEAAAAAKAAGDLEYFADAMEKARKAMDAATDAQAYNQARGEFAQARDAMEGIRADREKNDPGLQEWANAMQLATGQAVSGFSAAGFGMGETQGELDEITGQLDRIIRYMGDLVNKRLTVHNDGAVI